MAKFYIHTYIHGKFVTTDIYPKETNPHDYLNFYSAHPFHIKQTIPFNLSDPERMKFRLDELENWLLRCEYPKDLIKQAFHKAKVQEPAPFKERNVIPLVTTYYPNVSYTHIIKTISTLINYRSIDKIKVPGHQTHLSFKTAAKNYITSHESNIRLWTLPCGCTITRNNPMQQKELQTLPTVSPTCFIFSNSKWNNMADKTPNLLS